MSACSMSYKKRWCGKKDMKETTEDLRNVLGKRMIFFHEDKKKMFLALVSTKCYPHVLSILY